MTSENTGVVFPEDLGPLLRVPELERVGRRRTSETQRKFGPGETWGRFD